MPKYLRAQMKDLKEVEGGRLLGALWQRRKKKVGENKYLSFKTQK